MRFTGLRAFPIIWDSKTQIPLGAWHFVAATFYGHKIGFYLDGRPDGNYLVSEEGIDFTPNESDLNIGFDPRPR